MIMAISKSHNKAIWIVNKEYEGIKITKVWVTKNEKSKTKQKSIAYTNI